ncbi:RibD C-terminal domain-containing protein [Rathayibacter oskolensis]|uniref:RibD C-terminal domain-containing protein n=1 Tax=Rathayibacter oskolensis TaxID=1891671 RepID=A0A1X7NL87_9MICO|nr:dihydrofolate reductase family protein [Rathayibacter oskolensis]SMH38250.1 RibD C-terminal domain-containing protein [Rathayibacter oskolensis]
MGKIVVSSMVSIDGFTEGSGGDVSQMPMDLAFAEHNADRVRSASRLLFGARSYVGMMQYWPHQVDNEEAIPEDRYIASRYATDLGITVVSDSLTRADVTVWSDRTEIVSRPEAHAHLRRLRETEAEDILVFGSRTLWTDLLAHGLVDEMHLLVGPKIVAGDARAFTGLPRIDLTLLGVRTWKDSSTVALSYRPENAPRATARDVAYN